ncbi:peptidase domain-containing ABC transporter [Aquimarina sp. 2-A2]|uniref:peptidase domain-containing ABC transporter n=1 Tax=Aquimarina sp. 2-A2 TaxID=3382644 RepID=UPI00387F2E0F
MMFNKFPSYIQSESKDCGASCLKIISKHYGQEIDIEYIRKLSETTRNGTSLTGLIRAAEQLGFYAIARKESYEDLQNEIPLPIIAHWNQEHFVVIHKITNSHVYVSDPELGKIKHTKASFFENWIGVKNKKETSKKGIILHVQPLDEFYRKKHIDNLKERSITFLKTQLKDYKWQFLRIVLLVFLISSLELLFPYLTQQIIDDGVKFKDVNFVYLASIAYIAVFIGYKTANIIRNWIVIKLSMKLNINLISNFIQKLTKLPISYFDSKLTGDLFQRIRDHDNLERFFTSNSILALFSILNIILFSGLFLYYNPILFSVFLAGTVVHIFWIMIFFNKRKVLDFKFFSLKSKENSKLIELMNGMQDIKLNSYESLKREEWEEVKTKLYARDMESLKVEQFQLDGASLINEVKNIALILIAALLVIRGEMTLGTLLAISYVIGRLSGPINQIVAFLNNFQDIRLGFRRIMEIHNKEEETFVASANEKSEINGDIIFDEVSFRYSGTSVNVLDTISFTIPQKKITAIVGASGSGKTTILKLILKFYAPTRGQIRIGDQPLNHLNHEIWRSNCGVVMQEGYIFNDTILRNIITSHKYNRERLIQACEMSNIYSFIDNLPMRFKTKIGSEGVDISTGQKQRLLMARALYKAPEFLLFDEATSALDAKNEKEISGKLDLFFNGKTVLLIAHRLSTVKNADQIIVLSDNGTIEEIGSHQQLLLNRGRYFNLVHNQLELS